MDISPEQLKEPHGIACPKCLATATVVAALPASRTPKTVKKMNQPSTQSTSTSKPPRRSTPKPPRRATSRPAKPRDNRDNTPSDTFFNPATGLGCLWRSAVITVVLIVLYIIVGLLLG